MNHRASWIVCKWYEEIYQQERIRTHVQYGPRLVGCNQEYSDLLHSTSDLFVELHWVAERIPRFCWSWGTLPTWHHSGEQTRFEKICQSLRRITVWDKMRVFEEIKRRKPVQRTAPESFGSSSFVERKFVPK